MCIFLPQPGIASHDYTHPAEIKAAYLVNIAKFVAWPGNKPEITLCISPASPVRSYLDKVEHLPIGRRYLHIANPTNDPNSCDLFYWDKHSGALPFDPAPEQHPGLLTVSDTNSALEKGFTIKLYVRELKLKIAINRNHLDKVEFKISSQLLRIANLEAVQP